MKTKLYTLFVFLLITGMVVSCAPTPTSTPEQPAEPVETEPIEEPSEGFDWKQFEGSEITLLLNEHPWTEGLRTHVEEFEALTGIKVKMEAFAEDLYWDKMELALRSSTPVADVYFQSMDSDAFAQYSDDLIVSLTPFLNDPTMTQPDYDLADFPEGFQSVVMYPAGDANAQLYGIPITFEDYILFYNKDLVDEYLDGKLPASMEELISAANLITEKGAGEVYGSVLRGIRSDAIMDTVAGVVMNSWGSDPIPLPYNIWFDGSFTNPRVTDPRIVEGLANYANLMKAAPPNIQSIDWYEAVQLFQQGKAAFYIDASLFSPSFENPDDSQIAGRVGYAPLPNAQNNSMTGHWMWGLGITANSNNKEAAWYFIQWATSKDMDAKIGAQTGGATRLSTWSNETYTASLQPEYVTAVQTAMTTSRPTAVFTDFYEEVALAIVDTIQEIYGGMDPVEACDQLQNKIIEITAE